MSKAFTIECPHCTTRLEVDLGEVESIRIVRKGIENPEVLPLVDLAPYGFTRQQLRIVRYMLAGYRYAEIAKEMGVTIFYIRNVVSAQIYNKVGCSTQLEMVRMLEGRCGDVAPVGVLNSGSMAYRGVKSKKNGRE